MVLPYLGAVNSDSGRVQEREAGQLIGNFISRYVSSSRLSELEQCSMR